METYIKKWFWGPWRGPGVIFQFLEIRGSKGAPDKSNGPLGDLTGPWNLEILAWKLHGNVFWRSPKVFTKKYFFDIFWHVLTILENLGHLPCHSMPCSPNFAKIFFAARWIRTQKLKLEYGDIYQKVVLRGMERDGGHFSIFRDTRVKKCSWQEKWTPPEALKDLKICIFWPENFTGMFFLEVPEGFYKKIFFLTIFDHFWHFPRILAILDLRPAGPMPPQPGS